MAKSAKANSGAIGVPEGLPEGLGALSVTASRQEQREAAREQRQADRDAERAERQAAQQAKKQVPAPEPLPELAAATNTITGTDGDDILSGTATDDLILGLSGDDMLSGAEGSDTLYGGDNNDDLRGGAQVDTLFGGNGADVLNGNGGDDSLEGEGGADTFLSSNGTDTMRGAGGNDTFYQTDFTGNPGYFGGAGDGDSYIVEDNDLGNHVWLITPTAIDPPIPQTAWEVRRDGALLASGAQTEHMTIVAGFGNDELNFVGFAGALGIETIRFDGRAGNDSVNALGVPESIVISFAGGSGQDELVGHSGVDSMSGGSGDDIFAGGAGNDVYATGYDEGTDTANGGTGSDLFIGIGDRNTSSDWTLHGSGSGNLTAALNAGANGLTQATLFESIYLQTSLLDDTVSLVGDLSGFLQVSIDMEDGNDVLTARGASQLSLSFLTALMGGGGDTVLDSTGRDTVFGGSGSDTMDHLEGADHFLGGDGNNSLVFSNQTDAFGDPAGFVEVVGGAGTDLAIVLATARPATTFAVDNDAGGGLLNGDGSRILGHSQMEVLRLFAGGQNDLLGYANSAALQRLEVFGGTGDDKIFARASASDQVNLYAEGGLGDDSLWAGGGNDTLLGQEGLDRLRGGSGADSLHGGLGADSLFGEAGDDVLFFDIADLAVLGGSGMDTLIGNATADSVQFDAARFQFGTDRASIEEVHLGNGNDIFNNYSDPSGFAQLNSDGVSVYGGSGSDRISMRGAGAVSGTEDFVDGGAGHDEIWGGFGNDELWGGDGGDFLYGGKGDDKIEGGSGFDVFYIGQAEGEDAIQDNLAEVNGLVLFWGWDSTFPPVGSGADVFDGVDPDEIAIAYNGDLVEVTFVERGGTVTFDRAFNSGTGLWESSIDVINLWDYGDGDAGNSPTPPPQFERDVWSATFDATTGEFTAFTLAVDG